MVLILAFLELRWVEQGRKLVEVKHRIVLAVFAEKGDVLTQVHILQVIRDKAAVAALDALAEFFENLVLTIFTHNKKEFYYEGWMARYKV